MFPTYSSGIQVHFSNISSWKYYIVFSNNGSCWKAICTLATENVQHNIDITVTLCKVLVWWNWSNSLKFNTSNRIKTLLSQFLYIHSSIVLATAVITSAMFQLSHIQLNTWLVFTETAAARYWSIASNFRITFILFWLLYSLKTSVF
jgi:hypothetical protein